MNNAALAFVFPGQGSQKIGMLAELAEQHSIVGETFAEASDILGYDLWALCQQGEQDAINQTAVTQPLLLTASIAAFRIWQQQSTVLPAYVAGHSLGEWSALVAADVVDFADAVRLVQRRGELMQAAVPAGEGGMAAILGLTDEQVISVCADADAHAVNFNCPGQVVIAGTAAAVDAAVEGAKQAGAKRAIPLAVSAPFHTPMMKPAAEALATDIAATEFRAPRIPVVHNVTANTESSADTIKQLMVEQVYSAVKWTQSVEFMINAGIEATIECGTGKVLCGLNKKVSRGLQVASLEDAAGLEKALGLVN
ncbi:ACP S-malonyltransferase [Umboniibacter marinipuniceus]|uniref:Malonyl CoA-acyl carrier protein transacylase n=1 Tax=Umboniibacter marinipuniceus TaxID=569599 RepID=A0A3M0A8Z9_9GAMM|nr:ACP S-malonyltransferase [Umboniibacter marinipuniceus]RMA81086.1 [acyl-carrier-protein] S-malonyltransferase [Umboniibacter marinipuniceus]